MIAPTITVIGGGFSGTLLALWLQSLAPARARIYLIERNGRPGAGLAYSSDNPNHLLNVPAGRMGAFPDLPLNFVGWMKQQHPSRLEGTMPTEGAFVPRRLYGQYLQDLLDRALRYDVHPTRLQLLHKDVRTVREEVDGVTLTMGCGASLAADVAVLAIGNTAPLPPHPHAASLDRSGLWQADPWDQAAFVGLHPQAPVLLLGSGLTMVDAVIGLLHAGHVGPIHAVSRHGLIPRRHADHAGASVALPVPMPQGPLQLMRWLCAEAERSLRVGTDWQPVVDALRPVTRELWQAWGPAERERFMRHLRAWWDVHRHRMPPRIAERIEAATRSGQLHVHAGRILECGEDDDGAAITLRERGTGRLQTLRAARVIDCTGSGTDITRTAHPLLRALFRSGTARPDPLRLGLDVTPECAVRGRAGIASNRLFAIGPLTRGAHWEVTSVPDIRCQCRDLARIVAGRLTQLG
jgi:uncharacterized NAD(P)/FAD-binding protein YdhS